MLQRKLKPIAAAVGTAFVVSLGTASLAQADSPFVADELDAGYDRLAALDAEGKCGEGKCGEGKCGEDGHKDGEGKCGEGKCGEDGDKDGEGKCGEGKCGEDGDKDGEGKCGG
jgi:uncharacterized low-complexity protein